MGISNRRVSTRRRREKKGTKMARSMICVALLMALVAVFAYNAQAAPPPPCPEFRRCLPKINSIQFRQASDKQAACEFTFGGFYDVVATYGPSRSGAPRCKVACEIILGDGCPARSKFGFFFPGVDPEFGVEPPCVETLFAFAKGIDNCAEPRRRS